MGFPLFNHRPERLPMAAEGKEVTEGNVVSLCIVLRLFSRS
jgi:hypothetical protein